MLDGVGVDRVKLVTSDDTYPLHKCLISVRIPERISVLLFNALKTMDFETNLLSGLTMSEVKS